MKFLCIFPVLLLATFPVVAGGQSRIALAIGAGGSVPIGTLRKTQRSGTDFNVGLIRGSDESPIGLRLDFAYDKLKGKTVNGVKQPERRTTSGTLDLMFSFSGYTLKPYVFGGAGGFKMTSKPAAPLTQTRFGFDLGLGFTMPLGGKAVFLESRVNSVSQKNAKPLRYVPIILGFLF